MADQTPDASPQTPPPARLKAPNDHPPDLVECPTAGRATPNLDLPAREVINLGTSGSNLLHNVEVILRLTDGAASIVGWWLNGHDGLNSQRVRR